MLPNFSFYSKTSCPATSLERLLKKRTSIDTMGGLLSKVKSTASNKKNEKMSEPVGFTYFAKAQSTFKPPLIANENAYLGDIASR